MSVFAAAASGWVIFALILTLLGTAIVHVPLLVVRLLVPAFWPPWPPRLIATGGVSIGLWFAIPLVVHFLFAPLASP
jgi:hypothetical protein